MTLRDRVPGDEELPFGTHPLDARHEVRERRARRAAPKRSLGDRLRGVGVRGLLYQALVVGGVLVAASYLFGNLQETLDARGISTGFGFLDEEAGFAIGESVIPYGPEDSFGRAYLVAILNTLRLSAIAIVFATLIGVVVGIARLSGNPLVSGAASLYVELFRNTPQLVQIVFWYTLVTLLPAARLALEPVDGVFLSNRGLYIPWPVDANAPWVIAAFALAAVAAVIAFNGWQRHAREERRLGRGTRRAVTWGLLLAAPVLGWLAAGAPAEITTPSLQGFNFRGGLGISPEFMALCLGLSLYIAAFIAEIVRSGIQSVSRGQIEAARAIGMTESDVTRRVVLPQALRVMVPPTAAQYVSLFKNSSLGVAIGYPELFNINNTITTLSGHALECIGIMMLVYLSISFTIGILMNIYNRRVQIRER